MLENSHPYATSKRAGELAAMEAGRQGRLETSVLKLSNLFGRPMHRGVNYWMLVIQGLCRQAVQKKKMILRNPHREVDAVPMSAACSVIEQIIGRKCTHPDGNIFNLGSDVSRSVLNIANLIRARCIELLSYAPEIDYRELFTPDLPALHYKTGKLSSTGLKVDSTAAISELDSLILFCQREFNCEIS